jgi:hypothetical protein
MNRAVKAGLPLLLSFASFAIAQDLGKPAMPYVYHNICPFEYGCEFDTIYVHAPFPAYTKAGDTTSGAFAVSPGESLRFNFGDMYIERMGMAVIRDSVLEYPFGDTVYILTYKGEGSFEVWHRGKFETVEGFWLGPFASEPHAELILSPMATWWINVTDKRARIFWLRLINIVPAEGMNFDPAVSVNWSR